MGKYELTDETVTVGNKTLYRIKALINIPGINVFAGELGGFIETTENLCMYGNAWVSGNAQVYDNAQVYGDAQVSGHAQVYGNAQVYSHSQVYGNAQVYGDAQVYGNAWVSGDAWVSGHSQVYGNAQVYGDAQVYGNAQVSCDAQVYGNAQVYGDAQVYGNAQVSCDADYIVFKNWWSSGRFFTWTRSNNMWKVGCFYGTWKELIDKAYEDDEVSGREYERVVLYVEELLKENK